MTMMVRFSEARHERTEQEHFVIVKLGAAFNLTPFGVWARVWSDFTAIMMMIAIVRLATKLQLKALMKERKTAGNKFRNT